MLIRVRASRVRVRVRVMLIRVRVRVRVRLKSGIKYFPFQRTFIPEIILDKSMKTRDKNQLKALRTQLNSGPKGGQMGCFDRNISILIAEI